MSSMLDTVKNTQQNPSATPGWNDPPPSNQIYHAPANGNNKRLQRLRRPVDPSVQGNPIIQSQSPFQQIPSSNHILATPAPTNAQQFHQSRSFPQLHSPEPQIGLGIGTHPGSAFSPTMAAANMALSAQQQSQSQTSLVPSANPNLFVANPHPPHGLTTHPHSQPNLLATAAIPSPSMAPNLPQQQPTTAPPSQMQSIAAQPIIQQNALAPTLGHHYDQQNPLLSSQPPSQIPQIPPPMPMSNMMAGEEIAAANGHHHHAAMIFSPPNIVPLKDMDHQGQYGRPNTQPTPNDYRMPVKAAGDVSLNGGQLVVFLTKATLNVPQGPMREGIQLRINQFGEFVQAGQITEPCLKKLNFVVDAIDRRIYDEAWQFFEQMMAAFPGDCSLGGWAHGVRLLIQELRNLQPHNRAHSAGARQQF